tara:strand:+ start:375 stop:623 length:249 start_codon:yes stop_codon:yes gene_type:complete
MLPKFQEGNMLLFRTFFSKNEIISGVIIAVDHEKFGKIIKRVLSVEKNNLRLVGDNPLSTSSTDLGLVSNDRVLGILLIKIL